MLSALARKGGRRARCRKKTMSLGSGKLCQICQTFGSQGPPKKKKKATHTHGPEVRNSLGSQGTNSICLIICSVSVCPAKCRPISSPSNSEFLGLWIDVEGEMGSLRWGVQEIDD